MEQLKKEEMPAEKAVAKRAENETSYKERFQIVVKINDNIVCQRYFRINGFVSESMFSFDLKDTLDYVVSRIKSDLESKSRIYLWCTTGDKVKLTGFRKGEPSTYMDYGDFKSDPKFDESDVKPWDHVMKFSFIVDDKPVYEYAWDATVYPKFVRSRIDLSNGIGNIDIDEGNIGYAQYLMRRMCYKKSNLLNEIIREICLVCSKRNYGDYVFSQEYGGVTYYATKGNNKLKRNK